MCSVIDHLTRLQHEISRRDKLIKIQHEIGERDEHDLDDVAAALFAFPDEMERLSFFERAGLFHVEYHGLHDDECLLPVFETLCLPEVASRLGSIAFRGPDE
jgi:hypothetical protein